MDKLHCLFYVFSLHLRHPVRITGSAEEQPANITGVSTLYVCFKLGLVVRGQPYFLSYIYPVLSVLVVS